jgi:hypothetical protein
VKLNVDTSLREELPSVGPGAIPETVRVSDSVGSFVLVELLFMELIKVSASLFAPEPNCVVDELLVE